MYTTRPEITLGTDELRHSRVYKRHIITIHPLCRKLEAVVLSKSKLISVPTEADLRYISAAEADFRGLNLSGVSFGGAYLRGARFEGTSLAGVSFADADIRLARFDGAEWTHLLEDVNSMVRKVGIEWDRYGASCLVTPERVYLDLYKEGSRTHRFVWEWRNFSVHALPIGSEDVRHDLANRLQRAILSIEVYLLDYRCPAHAEVSRRKTSPKPVPGVQALRFNEGKLDLTLIPAEAAEAEARVWMLGAKKYGRYNWQKLWGEDSVQVIMASLLRHAHAIQKGEHYDAETGEPHAAHIRCNAAMLIHWLSQTKLKGAV